jgi:hypothetical protein
MFQRIQPHRHFRVAGRNDNQLVAQVAMFRSLTRIDRSQDEWSQFAVDVEHKEPAILCDVLLHEMSQKRTLTSAGLSKDNN